MLTTGSGSKSSNGAQDFSHILSLYIGLPSDDLRQIIELPAEEVLEDLTFDALVKSLDVEFLKKTLTEARTAYTIGLPKFMEYLESHSSVDQLSMSAYTLSDWLVRYLEAPETIPVVLNMHQRLTSPMIRKGLPQLLETLNIMPRGRVEWQRALAIMCLPLIAKW